MGYHSKHAPRLTPFEREQLRGAMRSLRMRKSSSRARYAPPAPDVIAARSKKLRTRRDKRYNHNRGETVNIRLFSRAYPFDFSAGRKARVPIALPPNVTVTEMVIDFPVSRPGWRLSLGSRVTKVPIAVELLRDPFPFALPLAAERLALEFFPPKDSRAGRVLGTLFVAGTKAVNLPNPENGPKLSPTA